MQQSPVLRDHPLSHLVQASDVVHYFATDTTMRRALDAAPNARRRGRSRASAAILAAALVFLGAAVAVEADDCLQPTWDAAVQPPAQGLIFATKAGRFVAVDDVIEQLRIADYALLGETHNDPSHHALQEFALAQIAATERKPAVVFEMFNRADEASIQQAAKARPTDPDLIAAAARWDESGWPSFRFYRPIVETALDYGLELVPGNFSRSQVRALVLASDWRALGEHRAQNMGLLEPLAEGPRALLLATLDAAHAGAIPAPYLELMLRAQRLRDASMADAMLSADPAAGAVLIAGREHTRLDYGVPFYLRLRRPEARVVSIGFLDARAFDPVFLAAKGSIAHDYLWLTAPETLGRRVAQLSDIAEREPAAAR